METLLEKIERGHLWDFHGGIHPNSNKSLSNDKAIARLPLMSHYYVPIKQHIGIAGNLLVQPGDEVKKGQPLTLHQGGFTVPVHAPTSGKVVEIKPHASAHPSGLPQTTLVIEPDGKDEWTNLTPLPSPQTANKQQILQAIAQAGISGLGGAGFPSEVKLSGTKPVEYLIINAVECEPYITADDLLMQEKAAEIVQGIKLLMQILSPQRVLVGIEDDKPIAISAMKAAAASTPDILVRELPTKYPSGGEKQLIKVLTGQEVPSGKLPLDIGVVMQNVGTVFAIAEAVYQGKPLIERVVTLTGKTLKKPQNVWARLGTQVQDLLSFAGFKADKKQRVIMGGPMMGFALPSLDAPVVKTTNCLLAPTRKELPAPGSEMACIRCSACADACPATLLPQQLLWYAKAKDQVKLDEYKLQDCIECGACAYVCPSEIPLVHYYRVAKAEIKETQQEKIKAEKAKTRFETRKERLQKEKEERQNKHKQAAARRMQSAERDAVAEAKARVETQRSDEKSGAVAAAIARAKAKRKDPQNDSDTPDNSEMAKLREARKAEARQRKAEKAAEQGNTSAEDKKAAVAAAIARAKAKKDATSASEAPTSADDKKAAVAAAIARAKAKKAAQAEQDVSPQSAEAPADTLDEQSKSDTLSAEDKKKAAVAAAIARAKAKKAAQAEQDVSPQSAEAPAGTLDEQSESDTLSAEDKKKAAVAAAIARAKAKKAAKAEQHISPHSAEAQTREPDEPAESDILSAEDKKKAAVAAAIARAKAKKAAKAEQDVSPQSSEAQTREPDEQAKSDTLSAEDKKKAAVAAAIARAKAKKEAQQAQARTEVDAEEPKHTTDTDQAPGLSPEEKKKAAVAKAIARAKAKKASQSEDPS